MTELSIILVNWKSAAYLRACLASIYRYTREARFEVIVVDNASNDGCETMLREEFPEAVLIARPGEPGIRPRQQSRIHRFVRRDTPFS